MADRPIIFSAPMVRALLDGRKTQTRRLLRSPMPAAPAIDAIHSSNIGRTLHPAPYFDAYCGERKTTQNPRGMSDHWCWWTRDDRQCLPTIRVGYVPGDRLWVRESAWIFGRWVRDGFGRHGRDRWRFRTNPARHVIYDDETAGRENELRSGRGDRDRPGDAFWLRPSIHMERWASRLTLTVTDVRVQQLLDMSEDDAIAEGIAQNHPGGWWSGADYQAAPTARAAFALLWNRLHGEDAWDANPHIVALTFSVERRNIDAP
jgi:hypothetical protein